MKGYIYKLINLKNRKFYIGSTFYPNKRKSQHFSSLKNKKHHNIYLQRSYSKYGVDNFNFVILHEESVSNDRELKDIEAEFIANLNPEYNIGGTTGGDNLTKHPRRDEIIKQIKDTINLNISSMTEEERKIKWGRPGKGNPNWNGGSSFNYCACGTKIAITAKTCIKCRDIKGNNNPFYGKTHTEEAKKKISEAAKGRIPSNAKEVFADGDIYPSLSSAARAFNITTGAMHYRVNSTSTKWEAFFYCEDV